MQDELLFAQRGAGLQVDWAMVSWAGLLWADGICQTILELELHRKLAGADAWQLGVLALRDSIQQPVLKPDHGGIWQAACTSDG